MNSNAIALSRVKTKRKKRKPPGPFFWLWAFIFAFYLYIIATEVIGVSTGDTSQLVWVGIDTAIYSIVVWPNFKREWDLWRKDDEE